MQYNRLGNTGLVVSRIAFGAMTFGSGTFNGFTFSVNGPAADQMVGKLLEAGVNFFDTAASYAEGQSEQVLGKALGTRRKEVVLTTKQFWRMGEGVLNAGLSYRKVIEACHESLRRLGTDYIDLYLMHSFDPHTPFEETARALDHLQQSGKIRYAGFSNFYAWQA